MSNIGHCTLDPAPPYARSNVELTRHLTRPRAVIKTACPEEGVMQSFVHRKNLEHFRKLLMQTTDEAERRTLLKLLTEEKAKDKAPTRAPNGDRQDP
jgi:hypothetical protein